MINTSEKKIGDNIYVVSQFGAKQARRVQFRLIKALGPAMAGLMKGGVSSAGVGLAVGHALQAFAESSQEVDIEYLYDAFASVTKVRQPIQSSGANEITLDLEKVFDSHFRGHIGNMNLWFAFAVEVNFSSFFPEIMSGDSRIVALFADPPPKPGQESE